MISEVNKKPDYLSRRKLLEVDITIALLRAARSFTKERNGIENKAKQQAERIGTPYKLKALELTNHAHAEAYEELQELPVQYAAMTLDRLGYHDDATLFCFLIERLREAMIDSNEWAIDTVTNYLAACSGGMSFRVARRIEDRELRGHLGSLLRERFNITTRDGARLYTLREYTPRQCVFFGLGIVPTTVATTLGIFLISRDPTPGLLAGGAGALLTETIAALLLSVVGTSLFGAGVYIQHTSSKTFSRSVLPGDYSVFKMGVICGGILSGPLRLLNVLGCLGLIIYVALWLALPYKLARLSNGGV